MTIGDTFVSEFTQKARLMIRDESISKDIDIDSLKGFIVLYCDNGIIKSKLISDGNVSDIKKEIHKTSMDKLFISIDNVPLFNTIGTFIDLCPNDVLLNALLA